jgi:hypothetical protein
MKKLIEPVISLQSYKNLFYMMTAFVFSNIYLVFFVTGFSLSLGLTITIIGIPLFILFLYLVRQVGNWEIMLANGFLNTHIEGKEDSESNQTDIVQKIKGLFTDVRVWKRMLYLMLKYPFDLAVFVIVIVFYSIALNLILAPILLDKPWYHSSFSVWLSDLTGSSLIVSVIGIFLLLFSFHVSNGLAEIYKKFTGYFLAN